MRWLLYAGLLLLASFLAGCGGGGGGGAAFVAPNLLTINYLDSLTTVPQTPGQPGTQTDEEFRISSRLRIYDGMPPMAQMRLVIPYFNTVLGMAGPYKVPASDGTNTGSMPFKVYWKSSETVAAGQPIVVPPGMLMPGYDKTAVPRALYVTSASTQTPIPISGTYNLLADGGFFHSWESPATQQPVAPVAINEPSVIVVDSGKSIHVTWEGVPGAVGYLVIADSLHDQNNSGGQLATWSSASQPIVFEALDYHMPYLLPASAREATIPAGIFRGCKTILIRVLAHGEPYVDTKSTPNLRLICGSLSGRIYALFQQQ